MMKYPFLRDFWYLRQTLSSIQSAEQRMRAILKVMVQGFFFLLKHENQESRSFQERTGRLFTYKSVKNYRNASNNFKDI